MTRLICSHMLVTMAVAALRPTLAAQQPVPTPAEKRGIDSILPAELKGDRGHSPIDSIKELMRAAERVRNPEWNWPPNVPREDPM